MAKYSLVMSPTPCRVAALTYLLTVSSGCIKPAISPTETVEDRAKVTINGHHRPKCTLGGRTFAQVVHGLSIAAKMYIYAFNS